MENRPHAYPRRSSRSHGANGVQSCGGHVGLWFCQRGCVSISAWHAHDDRLLQRSDSSGRLLSVVDRVTSAGLPPPISMVCAKNDEASERQGGGRVTLICSQ